MQSGETMVRSNHEHASEKRVADALDRAEANSPGIVARADAALAEHERRARIVRCPRGDGCRSAVCTEHTKRLGSAKDGF